MSDFSLKRTNCDRRWEKAHRLESFKKKKIFIYWGTSPGFLEENEGEPPAKRNVLSRCAAEPCGTPAERGANGESDGSAERSQCGALRNAGGVLAE